MLVDNGRVEVNQPHPGKAEESGHYLVVNTTISVSCDQGYNGGGSITCGKDGNWTLLLPSCSIGEASVSDILAAQHHIGCT